MKRLALTINILIILILPLILSGCIEKNDQLTENDRPHDFSNIDCFIAIHCEPGPLPNNTSYAARYWPALVTLVKEADNYGHNLTLLLNPQWVEYILADQSRINLVGLWEQQGHEIGLHHHGPHRNNWNGYTNQIEYQNSEKYLGSMSDLMNIMTQLPKSGRIFTAAVSDDTDDSLEHPANVPFDVDGGGEGVEDLISVPFTMTINNHSVTHLTHAKYGKNEQVSISFSDLNQSFNQYQNDQVLGVVFHAFEFSDDFLPFTRLFAFLDENNVHTQSVKQILKPSDL